MSEDQDRADALEHSRIDVHEPYELNVWAREFGVSQDQLKAAVQVVGPCAHAVSRYLAHVR